MKNGIFLKPHYFFPISFFVSFLFHLFFFSSFIFVLPVKFNEVRPNFIFWGAILKEYDIKGIDAVNKGFLPLHFFTARQGQGRGKEILKKEEIWLPHASFDKPIFNNLVPEGIKTTLKQAFFNNDTLEGKDEVSVDVGSTLPSYYPLKLFSNDQD